MAQKNKKSSSADDRLQMIRHSAEHIFNQAIEELYGDKVMRAMGPAIDDGWYNDSRWEVKLSEEDFPKIEKRMQKIIKADLPLVKKDVSVKEARELFKDNPFKQELLDEYEKAGSELSVYYTGDPDRQAGSYKRKVAGQSAQELPGDAVFVDLCKGPHVDSTGEVKVFKLLSIAGAYWRGDEKNEMLTRVYGTAFENEADLEDFLEKRRLAEERNHRKIGKEMELFEVFPEIGRGLPVWLPNGYAMRRVLEDYMLQLERKYGYVHVLTPHINKAELFERSGHLSFYKESMYAPMQIDDETYYLKPMNCPAGMMIYNRKPRSYRDLPIKMGELGTVYRYELSGELHGLQRVRGFTQNDAHIFCTPEQLEAQFLEVMQMLKEFYKAVGFGDYRFRLSLSDDSEDKYVGKREDWLKAEDAMREILDKIDADYYEVKGEAAFYGPKVDVQALNVFGKEDSVSTIQVDFNLAERFDISYVDENGEEKRPFVIHRALAGSFERDFAFLIEHHGGKFPLWFAPEQLVIVPVSDKFDGYAKKVEKELKEKASVYNLWVRSKVDNRSETLQARIRDAEVSKLPYILVVGGRDEKNDEVSVRVRGKGDIGAVSREKFIDGFIKEVQEKKLESVFRDLNL
jgi:threonyl-tRNA synthetase